MKTGRVKQMLANPRFLLMTGQALICLLCCGADHAVAGDLIMLTAVDESINQPQLERHMLDALAASDNKDVVPNVSRVSPRLFERFARMMKLKSIVPTRAGNDVLTQVEGNATQWNLDLGGQFPPAYLWLRWSEEGTEGPKIQEVAFEVRKPVEQALEATVQALNRDTLLIRTQESWHMLGYAPGGEKPDQKPEKFLEWPQPTPTYVITFRNFSGGEQRRQALVDALKTKIGEFIIVESPEQTVRLISVDIAPSKRDLLDSPVEGNRFLVRFNPIRERSVEEDQAVWALFPLTETQVKDLIQKMQSAQVNRDVAQLAKEGTPYPFVELQNSDETAQLPEGWPAPSGRFNDNFDPAWYVIPAWPDSNMNVQQFRRTLEIGKISPPEEDRWVVLMYVFHQKEDENFPWRAVRLPEVEQKRNAPHSTPYVVAFKMTDLAQLSRAKPVEDANQGKSKPGEGANQGEGQPVEKKATDPPTDE